MLSRRLALPDPVSCCHSRIACFPSGGYWLRLTTLLFVDQPKPLAEAQSAASQYLDTHRQLGSKRFELRRERGSSPSFRNPTCRTSVDFESATLPPQLPNQRRRVRPLRSRVRLEEIRD